VLAFFADKAIDLGGAKNGDDLLARFDLEGHAGTGFALGIGFAMIAPEPGTGGLLIVGLMWLAGRRVRAMRRLDRRARPTPDLTLPRESR